MNAKISDDYHIFYDNSKEENLIENNHNRGVWQCGRV